MTDDASTVTSDPTPELMPDTVTEEPLVQQWNEDFANRQKDDEPKQPETPPEKEGEKPPKKKRPGIRAMPDDTYIVVNEDGSEYRLTEAQVKNLAQKRVGKEVYRRAQAERELQALRARLAEMEKAAQQPKQPETPPDDDPEPVFEDGKFESITEFNRAWFDWKQRQLERQSAPKAPTQEEPSAQDQVQFEAWQKRAAEVLQDGKGRFDDWDDVVTRNEDAPFDAMFTSFIFDTADDPAAVLYELGQHEDEAQAMHAALAAGDQRAAARALGRIEARIYSTAKPDLDDGAPQGTKTQPAATRRAPEAPPPPINPVPTARGVASYKDPDKMTQREYEAWRASGGGR